MKHAPLMKEKIGAALSITADQVGVKATTNERMGFVGREEGIAAMAVACVVR
jgi:2-C-methyl-D-erythritol 2,4-cyclodiphosphate synthase